MNLTTMTTEEFEQSKIQIIQIIKKVIQEQDINLTENSLNNIAVHLTIAILRIKSNTYIPLSNSQIAVFKDDQNYAFASALCDTLAKEFTVAFPENEISLVTMYLSKSQLLDMEINSGFDLLDVEVFNILRETMFLIYKEYQQDFRCDDKLFVSIGLHLAPAIERLENDQQMTNPLTSQIMERHNQEFQYAKLMNTIIEKQYQKGFTNDELAFITLHFVVAINKKS